jgi:hypothetical protein
MASTEENGMNEAATPLAKYDRIIGANQYMVLATADATGLPWASPVWFASDDGRDLYWVSAPETRHSTNLAARPQLAITIFDSTQPPGTGEGAYLSAVGGLVPADEIDAGIEIYSAASLRAGLAEFSRADVESPSRLRLYRASAQERFVLGEGDRRVQVPMR